MRWGTKRAVWLIGCNYLNIAIHVVADFGDCCNGWGEGFGIVGIGNGDKFVNGGNHLFLIRRAGQFEWFREKLCRVRCANGVRWRYVKDPGPVAVAVGAEVESLYAVSAPSWARCRRFENKDGTSTD